MKQIDLYVLYQIFVSLRTINYLSGSNLLTVKLPDLIYIKCEKTAGSLNRKIIAGENINDKNTFTNTQGSE